MRSVLYCRTQNLNVFETNPHFSFEYADILVNKLIRMVMLEMLMFSINKILRKCRKLNWIAARFQNPVQAAFIPIILLMCPSIYFRYRRRWSGPYLFHHIAFSVFLMVFMLSMGNGKQTMGNKEQEARIPYYTQLCISAPIYNEFVCLFWTWIRIEATHFHKSFSFTEIANGFEIQSGTSSKWNSN